MKTAQLGGRIVALGLLVSVALPWPAAAQAEKTSSAPVQPDADAAASAGAQAWYREYIEPWLRTSLRDESTERNPVLYDPNESAPMPGKPIPERRVFTHRAHVGTVGAVLMAGDLPPTRSEWSDVRDWNDPLWPAEMFRFYFERVEPTPAAHPAAQ